MSASMFKVGQTCRILFNPNNLQFYPSVSRITLSRKCIQTSCKVLGVTEVTMPSLSPTMEQGNIVKWHKAPGDKINPGDVLCEIQTDKAVVSMDTEEEGILAKILKPDDSKDVVIGTLIALVVDEGDDWQNVKVPSSADQASSPTQSPLSSSSSDSQRPDTGKEKSNFMGPSVKKLLEEYGIKAKEITATGPHGALIKGDVISYVESKRLERVSLDEPKSSITTANSLSHSAFEPLEEDMYADIPATSMRKTIAKRLTESKSSIPHSYACINCGMKAVTNLRKELIANGVKVSMNDFVIKAVGLALQRVPQINSVWNKDSCQMSSSVDISIAVATDDGLITPIVHNANSLSVQTISSTVKELAEKARSKKLQLHEFQGGSFSISNLGMFGISEFTAVINPPQTAILAVGTTQMKIDMNGQPSPVMTVTLSYDSRVIDEVNASEFLEVFANIIENPSLMVERQRSVAAGEFF